MNLGCTFCLWNRLYCNVSISMIASWVSNFILLSTWWTHADKMVVHGGMSGSKRRQSIGSWPVGTLWDSLRLSPLELLRGWMAAGLQSWVHTDIGHHQFVRLILLTILWFLVCEVRASLSQLYKVQKNSKIMKLLKNPR